jgi:superfamily II DNA or RNA helicase
MNLTFFKQSKERWGDKDYLVRYAVASSEFWAKWRYNKFAMEEQGISIQKYEDEWIVRQVMRYENNVPRFTGMPPVVLQDDSKLLDYQKKPVSYLMASLLTNNRALDASDTGTGKTYMALKVCKLLGYQPAIVCTKTGIYDWLQVCNFMNVNPVFIYNWESTIGRVYRDKNSRKIKKICQPPNKYIGMGIDNYTGKSMYKWKIPLNAKVLFIFDEAHKANGNGTHNQKIVMAASQYKIMCLSATFADKLEKLRTIGSLIGLFKFEDFHNWLREKGCFVNNYNRWESISEREDMLEISKRIFPAFGVRVKKMDVPDFPDVQNVAKLYSIKKTDLQNKAYDKLMKQIQALEGKGDMAKVLALQLRHRQLAEMYKVDLLYDLINEYIDNGFSVVVFVNFTDTLRRLSKKCKTTCLIQGGQKPEARRKNINDFQSDKKRLLIANIEAGGTGLSLHDLNGNYPRVSIICPCNSAKSIVQVIGRIHRAGAKSKAMNLLVYAAGTIEQHVYKNVIEKIKNINALNDGDLMESEVFVNE